MRDGLMLMAVPVGADAVVWNVHRIYGRRRLSRLFTRLSLFALCFYNVCVCVWCMNMYGCVYVYIYGCVFILLM